MRNILSPILSGGAVLTCSGFDPLLFWDILYSGQRVTWYYAAPTMHHALLQEGARRPAPLPVDNVRFIANAAGGLLPVLAQSLRDTFKATILTSYGMTECMPISSPPQTYKLDPTGTSGIPVGPQVIIVDDSMVTRVVAGVKGNIFVKGAPCFGGYENNGTANEESFFTVDGDPGWFNTGDMGHLDANNYLFISGRSKEIINRGGETISPFEIEEAIIQHPLVKETIAFSAPHKEYQETVGAVIVTEPGKARVDLPTLHKYLEDKLHRSKWPQLIVYMEALPKNAAGKVLRIRLAERLKLKDIDEDSSPLTRIFEAKCPKVGVALTEPIELQSVNTAVTATKKLISDSGKVKKSVVIRVDLPFQSDSIVAFISPSGLHTLDTNMKTVGDDSLIGEHVITELMDLCAEKLHCYLRPLSIYILPSDSNLLDSGEDSEALKAYALRLFTEQNTVKPRNNTELQLEAIWREQLGAKSVLSVTASFFSLGGDSLKAGKLVAAMRKKLDVQLSVADLFTAPTIEGMAHKVLLLKTIGSPRTTSGRASKHTPKGRGKASKAAGGAGFLYQSAPQDEEEGEEEEDKYASTEYQSPFSNTSFSCLFVQALPLVVIYPIRRIIIWFLIAGPWVEFMRQGLGRFTSLVLAMIAMRVVLAILAPLAGIAVKWLLIGRYQPGRYPLWGSMYLRWWFVEKVVNVFGKGVFRDDLPIIGSHMVRLYYVMMGASIGRNVKIHRDAKIGQADLLTIGDDVCIDNSIIRAFSIEEGYFVLLPITIGSKCSVGVKTTVSAGTYLPPGTCLGPLSSSHEASEAEPHYRDYCRTAFPTPPAWLIILVGLPILLVVAALSRVPWFIGLHLMVADAKANGWYEPEIHSMLHAFLWWIRPRRLAYYFLLRAIRRCLVPFVHLGCSILIKWTIIGRFRPMGEVEKNQPWNAFRYWLMARLLPGGSLGGVAKLVGTHYAIVSAIYRLLGSKIGKRIYWPGSGLEIVEYDLLEIGDDVVFGSRSVVLTSSAKRSARVVLEAGCMVADRCVILPGVTLRRGAVLGSGSLAAEGMDIAVGSVWVGSRSGCAINVAPSDPSYATNDTMTPFGRAFYQRKAPYFVLPLWFIVLYNTLWQAFCTCYRNSPTALSLILCREIMLIDKIPYRVHDLFQFTLIAFIPLHLALCSFALSFDIACKWLLLGQRKQGSYAWDESSYCQRWQVYLTLEEIRRSERRRTGILDLIEGSQYLVWYFRCLGATIGDNVCLYPNGGDPMMTEPDLVTIGNGASIDEASLIAHINTRGTFRLNPLVVGHGCVLKSNTRLLSGATMENHSAMLEHTLVLAGETVDNGKVWQGWPSATQLSLNAYREALRDAVLEVSRRAQRQALQQSARKKSAEKLNKGESADSERQPLLPVSGSTNVNYSSNTTVVKEMPIKRSNSFNGPSLKQPA